MFVYKAQQLDIKFRYEYKKIIMSLTFEVSGINNRWIHKRCEQNEKILL